MFTRLGDMLVITLRVEPMGYKAIVECKMPPLDDMTFYGFSEKSGLTAISNAFKIISEWRAYVWLEKEVNAELQRIQENSKL